MGTRGFGSLLLLVIITVVIVGLAVGLNKFQFQTSSAPTPSPTVLEESPTPIKDAHDSLFKSFIRDTYPQFPKLKSRVTKEQIKNVFPLSLSGPEGSVTGWIVEADANTDKSNINHIYFLLTPALEKELADAVSTEPRDSGGNCVLNEVKLVDDHVVLSSKLCHGYGASGVGSVSIYKLPDGEKINFQGTFYTSDRVTFATGVSENGNALGIFRDVHGIKQPMVAVDYSSYSGVVQTAYFDLKTGKLQQLVKFN